MQVHSETDPLDWLTARIAALEVRVTALEHPSQTAVSTLEQIAQPSETQAPHVRAASEIGIGITFTGILSLVGAALLGIAGAYILRAISGAGLLPPGLVAGSAAFYATAWLVAAARTASGRLAACLFAATSVLILAPMLWEMSIRFQAMSATAAAGYLAGYATIAMGLSLRSGIGSAHSTALTVAISGSALIALALSIATHSMALFTAILVAMCAAIEFSAVRDRVHGVRVLVTLSADCSVWILLHVYSLPPGEQTGYPPLSPAAILCAVSLLFAIQVVSLAIHAVRRAQPVGVFTGLQVMISFGLLLFGTAWFIPVRGAQAIGLICLLLSLGGYSAAYGPMRRAAELRNRGIFIVWSCALFLAAAFLLASPVVASTVLGTLAVASVPLAARLRARSIEVQGMIFLCSAVLASGLLAYAASALAGKVPGSPSWPILLNAILAMLVSAMAAEAAGEPAIDQALHLVQTFVAACGAAALLARGLIGLAALILTPGAFHIAVLRTLALCVTAVALTWLGAHFGRVQMMHVAYVALALAAVKLLFEDLRHGKMEFIAVSVALVALTFMSVPRVARAQAVAQPRS